jgi:hypothetical protein
MEDIEYTTCVPFLVTVATETPQPERTRVRRNPPEWYPFVLQEEGEA